MHRFRSPRPTGRSLSDRFDPRDNSIGALRLLLAGTVVVVHAQALGWQESPLIGRTFIGDLAVDGFFVVSGFLVTRSATTLPTLRRFTWHRLLRIMPGFWAALALTALVAAPLLAVLQGLPASRAFAGPDGAHHYLLRNSLLFTQQWSIAGLRAGPTGHEQAMNGSLWTLFYEVLCYGLVAVLVAVGVIRRRGGSHGSQPSHVLPLAATAGVWAVYMAHSLGVLPGPEFLVRFLLMFLLGGLGHLFANRIRFTAYLLVPAAALALASMFRLDDYRCVGAVPFAYLLLWACVALPVRWASETDLSYGLYVFHWPVQTVLIAAGGTQFGRVGFTVLALITVTFLALASWHLLEAPALRFKHARWIDHPGLLLGLGRPGQRDLVPTSS